MTKMSPKKIIFITGASSGIGKAIALALAVRGHVVYGTSRSASFDNENIVSAGQLIMIPMDVNDDNSVNSAVNYVLEKSAVIDVLINNAGYGIAGSIEEATIAEAKEQFETNFFCVHRVCRAIIPLLRKQGYGHIINIGSLGGVVSVPFQAFYSATKSALASLSDGLSMELKPFGIKVTRIEPGDYRTGFTAGRVMIKATDSKGPYFARCSRAIKVMEYDEQNGADPEQLARQLVNIVESPDAKPVYRAGIFMQRFLIGLIAFLPNRLVEKMLMGTYKI